MTLEVRRFVCDSELWKNCLKRIDNRIDADVLDAIFLYELMRKRRLPGG
jgi:hypothetical protein